MSSMIINNNKLYVKPFLKWAGGKGSIINEIAAYYPFDNHEFYKYAEPFVGGGAVLFDILNKYHLKEIYISDINESLINTYYAIRDNLSVLSSFLEALQSEFLQLDINNRKHYYLCKRARYNDLISENSIEKAALMIFLNKTCFNGLYRVNGKGFFNVPFGLYKNPLIYDKNNLCAVSEKLKNVHIVFGDYQKSSSFIDNHTFVYFDPPYRPITATSNFTSYTEGSFNDNDQIILSQFVSKMSKRGAKILLSNSDPKNYDDNDNFFDKIYSYYMIKRIKANRVINCNGSSRGKISELLISNY